MLQPNGGFTFNGVPCKRFGIEYAPELTDTYVYNGDKFKNSEESFDAHDGGYYYGSTVETKEFTLRCFYEETEINDGILTKIASFFRRGTTGRLVFDSRPWLWYVATVTSVETTKITNYLNGYVTIKMKAYYPYARYDYLFLNTGDSSYDNIIANSALLPEDITPITIINNQDPITQQTNFLLYNGGTEKAKLAIKIQGTAGTGGITIANATNRQKMRIVNMNTGNNGYYVCDGLTGKCMFNDDMKFEWHDYGFIELEPAYPIDRNIHATAVTENTTLKLITDYMFLPTDIGRYVNIYIDGDEPTNSWHEIKSYSFDTELNKYIAVLDGSISEDTECDINIVTMNNIIVTPGTTMSISYLEFIYKPTFS